MFTGRLITGAIRADGRIDLTTINRSDLQLFCPDWRATKGVSTLAPESSLGRKAMALRVPIFTATTKLTWTPSTATRRNDGGPTLGLFHRGCKISCFMVIDNHFSCQFVQPHNRRPGSRSRSPIASTSLAPPFSAVTEQSNVTTRFRPPTRVRPFTQVVYK